MKDYLPSFKTIFSRQSPSATSLASLNYTQTSKGRIVKSITVMEVGVEGGELAQPHSPPATTP